MNIKANMILMTFLAIFLSDFYDSTNACDSDCEALDELGKILFQQIFWDSWLMISH